MNHNIPPFMDIEKCPGFGFFPSEERLINIFLAGKNSGQAKKSWPILEIDLCAYEPRDLIDLPTAGCDDYKYFFNRRQYADERKRSYKRRTKTGYWKSTGKPRKLENGTTKRSLVFYKKDSLRGSKEVRTGWIIQEYDNGGQYVIAKLQIKDDKIKKSKLRRRNVSTDDFAEDNISTDASVEDNQIDSHESENFSGFEDQNLKETSNLMAPVYNKNSFSNESGGKDQNDMTANYSGSEVFPTHFVDQNWKNINITENQLSRNESEGEWSPITASPYKNSPIEAIFSGEGETFFPDSADWSLYKYNDPAATNLDQSDWWNNMIIFN